MTSLHQETVAAFFGGTAIRPTKKASSVVSEV
jgi:hypothetical protein